MLVKPTGGTELSGDTVQAIVHLVASSIPNMNARRRDRRRLERQRAATRRAWTSRAAGASNSRARSTRAIERGGHRVSSPPRSARTTPTCTCSRDLNFDKQKTTSLTNKTPERHRAASRSRSSSRRHERDVHRAGERRRRTASLGVTQGTPGAAGGSGPTTLHRRPPTQTQQRGRPGADRDRSRRRARSSGCRWRCCSTARR